MVHLVGLGAVLDATCNRDKRLVGASANPLHSLTWDTQVPHVVSAEFPRVRVGGVEHYTAQRLVVLEIEVLVKVLAGVQGVSATHPVFCKFRLFPLDVDASAAKRKNVSIDFANCIVILT